MEQANKSTTISSTELINTINSKYLKQIKKARQEIKYNRKNFWQKNRVNFRNNLKTMISFFQFPENWTVNIVASYFLIDQEAMPYDPEIWSFSDVVSATPDMGYNIIIFFNRSELEFLSAPAILPLVIHEIVHVYQAPRDTKKYVLSGVDVEINREFEREAEAEVRNYSDEFRKENVLEKILYCYDKKGWKGAKKMAHYLFFESKDAFGGGYDQDMTEEEYKIFQKSEEEKDIEIFIDYFIENLKEEEEEETPQPGTAQTSAK